MAFSRAGATSSRFVTRMPTAPRASASFTKSTWSFSTVCGIALSVEQRLPLAHHAQHMVVQHQLDHRDIVAGRCGDLIHVHTEAAVAGHIDHQLIRTSQLRAKAGAKAVPHGSQAS